MASTPFSKKRNTDSHRDMSFVDHLEALRWHIIRSLIALLLASILAFIFIEKIFDHLILAPSRPDFISYRYLCKLGEYLNMKALCFDSFKINFQNTQLSGQFMMSFSSAFVFGFIFSFPYIAWELWRFIKPGLSAKELRHSRGILFWVSVLFFLGVGFGYFIIAPYTIQFFANYKLSEQFQNIIKIDDYLSNVINLTLGTGLVFELPVIVYFLSKVGILTPSVMREYKKYAIVIILVLAAIITPPDVFSQIIVAIPLWILYEISIVISARVEKERKQQEIDFFKS